LQLLRSKSAAHRKLHDYTQILEKLGLTKLAPKEIIEKLAALLTKSLENVADEIT